MGKYLIVILFSLLLTASNVISTEELEEKVNAIQAPRAGLSLSDLQGVNDPFIYLNRDAKTGTVNEQKLVVEKDIDLNLSGVMDNKAFINNNWMSKGEKIGNYAIVSINKDSVLFNKNGKTKKVFVDNKQEDFIKLQKDNKK